MNSPQNKVCELKRTFAVLSSYLLEANEISFQIENSMKNWVEVKRNSKPVREGLEEGRGVLSAILVYTEQGALSMVYLILVCVSWREH